MLVVNLVRVLRRATSTGWAALCLETKFHAHGAMVACTQEINSKCGFGSSCILSCLIGVVLGITLSGVWAAMRWITAALGYEARLGLLRLARSEFPSITHGAGSRDGTSPMPMHPKFPCAAASTRLPANSSQPVWQPSCSPLIAGSNEQLPSIRRH